MQDQLQSQLSQTTGKHCFQWRGSFGGMTSCFISIQFLHQCHMAISFGQKSVLYAFIHAQFVLFVSLYLPVLYVVDIISLFYNMTCNCRR